MVAVAGVVVDVVTVVLVGAEMLVVAREPTERVGVVARKLSRPTSPASVPVRTSAARFTVVSFLWRGGGLGGS